MKKQITGKMVLVIFMEGIMYDFQISIRGSFKFQMSRTSLERNGARRDGHPARPQQDGHGCFMLILYARP